MSWQDDYGLNWDEEWKLFCDTMNSLPLPDPDPGEDIWDYGERLEEKFNSPNLPPPFEGELFNFIGCEEFADYLRQYRNIYVRKETKYTLWRK